MKFLNGWTKNKVIKHIEENFKGKAFNKQTNLCQYKTIDGKKCAVGLFIPEKHKAFKLAGNVDRLLTLYPDLTKVMPLDITYLTALQRIHDSGDKGLAIYDSRTDEIVLMDLISYIESET